MRGLDWCFLNIFTCDHQRASWDRGCNQLVCTMLTNDDSWFLVHLVFLDLFAMIAPMFSLHIRADWEVSILLLWQTFMYNSTHVSSKTTRIN